MFPWLPDINLFNFSGRSHGKLINAVVFFYVLALELLLTHLHPLSLLLGHLQVLGLLLVLHQGALFLLKQEGPRKWMIKDNPAKRLADNSLGRNQH